jgi:hypothetical protein
MTEWPRGTAARQCPQVIRQLRVALSDFTLLSRGPQVRVLPGAPFPKEFASLDREEISRRHKSKKVTGLANVRHISRLHKRAGGSPQAITEDALSTLRRLYSAKKRGEVCSIWPRLTRPERVA